MNKKLLAIALITGLFFAGEAIASLDNNAGARGEGIGFSYAAIAWDAFGALHNPAGIAFSRGWQVQLQYLRPTEYGYSTMLESPYSGLMAARYSDDRFGSIAFNAFQNGSTAEPTSIATTNTVSLNYARKIFSIASFGVGGKYQFETDFGRRKAFDLDVGVNLNTGANFSIALGGENLLRSEYKPTWLDQTTYLDRKGRASVAYEIPLRNTIGYLLAGYQATETGGQESQWNSLYNFGSEWWFGALSKVSFGLRGGYTMGKAEYNSVVQDYNRIHAGISLNINMAGKDMRIDYGVRTFPFKSSEDFAIDQFISFSYGFGGVPEQHIKTRQHYTSEPAIRQELTKPITDQPAATTPAKAEPAPTVAPTAEKTLPSTIEPPSTPKPQIESTKPAAEPPTVAKVPVVEPQPQIAPIPEAVKPLAKAEVEKPIEPTNSPIPAEPLAEKPPVPSPLPEPKPAMELAKAPDLPPTTPPIEADVPPPAEKAVPVITAPSQGSYMKLSMGLEVSELNMTGERRIVFYVRPERVVKLTSWKLYVLKTKPKNWTEPMLEADAIYIAEGKGIPPINVIWNGIDKNGVPAASGKYHFIITGIDKFGQRYMSDWCKFGLD